MAKKWYEVWRCIFVKRKESKFCPKVKLVSSEWKRREQRTNYGHRNLGREKEGILPRVIKLAKSELLCNNFKNKLKFFLNNNEL